MIDVELSLLPGAKAVVDLTRVRAHLASAEVLARLRLLEDGRLEPGRSGLAQLRLERPSVAVRGDLLVLRSYSPAHTIGGARVLDPRPPKRRAGSAAQRLRALQPVGLSVAQVAAALAFEMGPRGLSAPDLAARLGLKARTLAEVLKGEAGLLAVGRDPTVYVSPQGLQSLADVITQVLARFHREQPLRQGMPREELRRRLAGRAPESVSEAALQAMADAAKLRLSPDTVALASHSAVLGSEEEKVRGVLLAAAREAGLQGVLLGPLAERLPADRRTLEGVARLLQDTGVLRRVGEGFLVPREALDALVERVRQRWRQGSTLDVAGFKELTGLTRKHVIPLLEYLDRERVTRRVGADRTVL
jgi:selenocysteine-specific elongation factor